MGGYTQPSGTPPALIPRAGVEARDVLELKTRPGVEKADVVAGDESLISPVMSRGAKLGIFLGMGLFGASVLGTVLSGGLLAPVLLPLGLASAAVAGIIAFLHRRNGQSAPQPVDPIPLPAGVTPEIAQAFGTPIENASPAFTAVAQRFYDSLPERLRTCVADSGYKIFYWKQLPPKTQEESGFSRGPWGVCRSSVKTLVIPERVKIDGGYGPNPDWKNVLVHEVGHLLDRDGDQRLSLDIDFIEAAMEEVGKMNEADHAIHKAGLMYNQDNMDAKYWLGEVFAQMTSEHFGVKSILFPSADFLKTRFPKTYKRYCELMRDHYQL